MEELKEHLKKFIDIDPIELEEILSYFNMKSVAKKENILEEGQVCKYHFFVLKGILRKFFVNEKGVEQTTEFAIENWWMTDNMAFEHSHFVLHSGGGKVRCGLYQPRKSGKIARGISCHGTIFSLCVPKSICCGTNAG